MAIQIFALIMLRHSDSAGRLPPGVGFFLGGDLRVEYLPWVLYHEIDWKNESLVWKYFDQLPWHV